MVMIVLAAYVFCQMVLPGVQHELDRRLALVRGRTTEEEEEELTPSQKRELERKRAADSLAETVESIIVAFILAFLFRAFVVEAFVIPTGSMASTLMGEHNRYKSPTGYEYEYGDKSGETSPTCPLTRRQDAGGRIEHSKESGDRILVEKYSVLLGHLRRWSVVVFRNPRFPHDAALDARNENFIKRLVGLPNEIIMILDGDVYAAPASDELTAIHEARLELLAQCRRLEPRIAPRPLDLPAGIQDDFTRALQRCRTLIPTLPDADAIGTQLAQWRKLHDELRTKQNAPATDGNDDAVDKLTEQIRGLAGQIKTSLSLVKDALIEHILGRMKICQKIVQNPKAQNELWMPVYSSTYWLNGVWGDGGTEDDHRWVHAAADAYSGDWKNQPHRWKCDQPTFVYNGHGDREGKLRQIRYVHLHKPQLGLSKQPAVRRRQMLAAEQFIDDFYAYNGRNSGNMVSDLMISTDVQFGKAGDDGRVEFTLTKYGKRFTAVLYAGGKWKILYGDWNGLDKELPPAKLLLDGNHGPLKASTHVEFANVDCYLRLRIDGKEVYGDTSPQLTNKSAQKLRKWTNTGSRTDGFGKSTRGGIADTWPRVMIGAAGVDLQMRNVNIFRDVYYTNSWRSDNTTDEFPYATTNRPLRLKADDFFMLGDNSPASSDGRLWSVAWNPSAPRSDGGKGAWRLMGARAPSPITRQDKGANGNDDAIYLTHLPPKGRYTPGTVPRSYLIGRAFFVYWPSGVRPFGSPLPIVPQVQRMRMIR